MSGRFEDKAAQGRQGNIDRARSAVPPDIVGVRPPEVPEVPTPIPFGIAIHNLTVKAPSRDANSVVVPGDGSEVEYENEKVIGILCFSQEADYGILVVSKIDPLETLVAEVHLVHGRFSLEQLVEISDKCL